MRLLVLFVLTIFISSCSNSSSIHTHLLGSDSLVITFNAPNSDSVIKTVSTTEVNAINKLTGFLQGKKSEQFKCGYDGNFIFYKEGKELLPVIFKYSEKGCEHFLFDIEDKVTSVAMNAEAERFFKSLLEGKGWY